MSCFQKVIEVAPRGSVELLQKLYNSDPILFNDTTIDDIIDLANKKDDWNLIDIMKLHTLTSPQFITDYITGAKSGNLHEFIIGTYLDAISKFKHIPNSGALKSKLIPVLLMKVKPYSIGDRFFTKANVTITLPKSHAMVKSTVLPDIANIIETQKRAIYESPMKIFTLSMIDDVKVQLEGNILTNIARDMILYQNCITEHNDNLGINTKTYIGNDKNLLNITF